jgi:hypothetical protein
MHVTAIVADVDLDTCRANTLQHGALAKITAADLVPHLRQHDGNSAHARSPDANDVQTLRPRQVERDRR